MASWPRPGRRRPSSPMTASRRRPSTSRRTTMSVVSNHWLKSLTAACPQVGYWSDKPASVTQGFIFAVDKGAEQPNLETKWIPNADKHIEIFIGDQVWEY